MATALSEIYDLFLMQITDYRLEALWELSEDDLETYLEGFLVLAINDFPECVESLKFDSSTGTFEETLSRDSIVVLSALMRKQWLLKSINDITQMNLHVTDRDFKTASEAMNLREKSIHFDKTKEECSQLLIDYAYRHNDWAQWLSQSF